ncbi:signal transducer and activator of transcription 5B [Trichonephila inaurata madagascariensis]|uniref:Signal transducer and activator of transcription n=1 Tax=Trichonephila inaurata madagascariensis TaxID=2747483 RepID=A0A8X6XNC3_9ARAC|nr:signal transducer and activator of transcription 5B [Trichonephila inaurata madagascariensis]
MPQKQCARESCVICNLCVYNLYYKSVSDYYNIKHMALWARVQQLHGEALQQVGLVYNDNFPIDVRCALAQWIEEQAWNDLDPDNPQHDLYISQVANNFVHQLEAKLSTVDDFLMRVKLNEAISEFRAKYVTNPRLLVKVIKHCLNTEMRIVQQAEEYMRVNAGGVPFNPDPVQEINIALEKLRQKTAESGDDLRKMIQCQEAFVIQYQESSKRQAQMQQSSDVDFIAKAQKEKHLYDNAVRNQIQELIRLRMKLVEEFQATFLDLNELQKRILDTELIKWKRAQQLAGNGEPFHNNLDQIQEWCEALADIIWQNRQQIRQVENLASQVPLNIPGNVMEKLPVLNNQITGLLSSLVTSTFIIEKQPPQVLKTNTRFSATVRLLVGSKLSVYMTPPQVKVTIISEAQAIALLKNDKVGPGEASGEILNNMGIMEYHQATRQLSVSFRNLQLRKIKRAEKKGTESVMDEKFSLLFQSQFKVGGGELVFQVWTLSLPVVVIVHGNQDPHAWATITWDNAFAEPGRVPFQVPEKVPWKEVAEVLSTKFKSGTGRPLSEDNLQFLAGKVFRSSQFIDGSAMVTWSQFCKEPLPERNFTFWEWFYAIMKVTREHLRNLWNDGLIIGFIGRHQAEEMLLKKCNGTFLLRFSDSEAGGVTIAWVTDSQQREGQEVFMVQPFTSRDFAIRPIADRIYDLKNLLYLFPDIQKDQAFGKYYTPFSGDSNANGYVKPVLVTHLPSMVNTYGYDSYPNTPQSTLQSPDPGYHDSHSSDMQAGAQFPEVDYDLLNMEFAPEVDEPVDFSSINVCDLVSYTHSS